MSVIQEFDLNIIPDSAPVVIHCDQYDHGTGRLVAHLYKGSVPYTTDGTAIIQGRKPDGRGFTYAATISGGTVTADLTEQMTAVEGNVAAQFVVTDSQGRIGSFAFFISVQRSALPADTDMSESDYQYVEQLIDAAEGINAHPPVIGQNGNWWIWSIQDEAYVDSGIDASITITVGTTTTLPAGSSATVTNTGTSTDPIFNFGIPKGDKGDKGDPGAPGTDENAVHWSESKGYVGKNLLNNIATTKTIQQVAFTVNDDKSVNVNGTNSGNENNLELGNMVLKAGKYIVSGTGFSSNTLSYQITDYPVTKQLFRIYNGDTEITLENDTHICVRLVISQGGTYSNHIVYPMIRLSSISDDTYEPYLTPNTDLMSYADNAVLGAKNLVQNKNHTRTQSGITFTVNTDGSVIANGSAPSSSVFFGVRDEEVGVLPLKAGKYKLSGCPSIGSSTTCEIRLQSVSQPSIMFSDFGDGCDVSLNNDISDFKVYCIIKSGYAPTNLTFYPMIRLASDTDNTYAPYAMTNRELTEKLDRSLTILTLNADYVSSFKADTQKKLIRQGNICEILVGDLECTQAITLTAWKQIFYDIPAVSHGSYLSGIFLTVGRETMIPVQIDYRDGKWGIAPTKNISLSVGDKIHFHIMYICAD